MPHMGESIVEGKVLRWVRREGQAVQKNETIAEVETDKADVEIPAPTDGVLAKILVPEGATAAVGAELAVIEPAGAAEVRTAEPPRPAPAARRPAAPEAAEPEAAEPAAAAPARPAAPAPRPVPARPAEAARPPHATPDEGEPAPTGRRVISPVVAKLMEQHELTLADLERVEGSGLGGRVTKQDLLAHLERRQARAAAPERPPPDSRARVGPEPRPAPAGPARPAPAEARPSGATEDEPVEVVPLEGLRKAIAEHMVASVRTAPHVTTVAEVDVTELVRFRAYYKARFESEVGAPLTYLPFIVRALLAGLRAFPMLNSSLEGERILVRRYYHIGVAVAAPEGLLVPVLRHADRLSVRELARAIHDLVERARVRRLRPEELGGGTFSVTNPGVFGGVLSTPIIHQPQAAILGVQAIRTQPAVREGQIVPRELMYLCLSYDHRIVDGATAVQFLQHLRADLEHPLALLI
jgi:2-oxoglutarate dehydrogenase E2 component (dihydrolipoamide succinyltransferase)